LVAQKLRNRHTTFWRYPGTSWDGSGHPFSGRPGHLDWRGRVCLPDTGALCADYHIYRGWFAGLSGRWQNI